MSRMKILNAVEKEQFESPPVFNSVQRKQYFDFSSDLLTLAQDLQTPTNQVCFSGKLRLLGMFQQRYVKRHEIWPKPAYTHDTWLFGAPRISRLSGR